MLYSVALLFGAAFSLAAGSTNANHGTPSPYFSLGTHGLGTTTLNCTQAGPTCFQFRPINDTAAEPIWVAGLCVGRRDHSKSTSYFALQKAIPCEEGDICVVRGNGTERAGTCQSPSPSHPGDSPRGPVEVSHGHSFLRTKTHKAVVARGLTNATRALAKGTNTTFTA